MAIEETEQTTIDQVPLGQGRRDLELVIRLNAEQFRFLYPAIAYYELDRSKSHDDLYGESPRPVFKDAVEIPTYIQIQPQLKLLKKYGIEEEQEAIAVYSNRLLNLNHLTVITGDRVVYYDVTYEVLTVKFSDYFLNTQVPLNTVATLKQVSAR